jgi:hypothetical protein
VVSALPGFHSVELPMHGWFLPALGLAILGGAGLARLSSRPLLPLVIVGVVFLDVLTFNSLQNRLAFSRLSADELFATQLRSLQTQLAQTPVERLYGPPMTSIGYRNSPLQLGVEATFGYNPLALAAYADYQAAAEGNPRLIDGLAATHSVKQSAPGTVTLEPNPTALPRAFLARAVRPMPDLPAAAEALASLDPARETLVVEPVPAVEPDPGGSATVMSRGDDYLTVHYRSATPNLLRVAIPRFPGWHATLNGAELQVVAVDYALLGVVVPAGEGDVRIQYAPRFFWPGAIISAAALLAALGALVMPYLMATALAGEPTPPRTLSGLPTNRNS